MKDRRGRILLAALAALAVLGALAAATSGPPGRDFACPPVYGTLRCALPDGATDIQVDEPDMFPDFTYRLKATIAPGEFEPYARRVGLLPHTPERVYTDDSMWLSWITEPECAFWDPSPDTSTTWVAQAGTAWTMAKYERGHLYVVSFSH